MPAVLQPNIGLVLDRPPISIPPGGLRAGRNFAIRDGQLTNANLGWTRFGSFQLGEPVTGIHRHESRLGIQTSVFCTTTDIYKYVDASTVEYLTPIYATGTVDVSADDPGVVTVTTGNFTTGEIKAGDQIHFGAADQNDPAALWYTIDTVDSASQATLSAAVAGGAQTGVTYTIRRIMTGSIANPWSSAQFLRAAPGDDDWLFLSNGIDQIVKWDGSSTFASYSSITTRASTITTFKNMLVLGDITASGDNKIGDIANSKPGTPEDFATGLASQLRAYAGGDAIVALKPLGDTLVIYTKEAVLLADFVGDPFIWIFRTISNRVGCKAKNLVADFGDYHKFIGPDTQYIFDGAALQETGEHVWRSVLRQVQEGQVARGLSHFVDANGELIWSLPITSDTETDQLGTAWTEHYLEEVPRAKDHVSFGTRDFPFTATGYFVRAVGLTWADLTGAWESYSFRWSDNFFAAAFPQSLAGDADGYLYTLNTAQTGDGADLPSYVRTGRMATGDGQMRACLARVYPFASVFAESTMSVQLWLSDSAHGDSIDGGAYTISMAMTPENHFVSPFRVSRFIEIAFETDGSPWELAGWNTEIRAGGMR